MKIELYTKNNCPRCDQLKNILTQVGQGFDERNIEDDASAYDELFERAVFPVKMAPQVFVDGKHTQLDTFMDIMREMASKGVKCRNSACDGTEAFMRRGRMVPNGFITHEVYCGACGKIQGVVHDITT